MPQPQPRPGPTRHGRGRPAPARTTHAQLLLRSALLGVGLPLLMVACSSAAPPTATADPTPVVTASATAEAPTDRPARAATETTVSVGVVRGEIGRGDRRRAVRTLGRVVDRWLMSGYLGGDYPRGRFGERGLRGFTVAARARGRADRDVLTNARLGPTIEGVVPKRRRVRVDLLAVRGRVMGATARVRVKYRTVGTPRRTVEIGGRVFLRPGPSGWRIFGYEVSRGVKAAS